MTDPAPTPTVVLTGFMGTGKTTVGRIVALRLGAEFIDTDELIESRHGSIPEIFATAGEAGFRQYEHAVAIELGGRSGLVVSTGGRMMLDPDNVAAFGSGSVVVCLTAPPVEIIARVRADGTDERPMLAGHDPEQRVTELLRERAPAYAVFRQITTGGRTPDEVADEIVDLVRADHATT